MAMGGGDSIDVVNERLATPVGTISGASRLALDPRAFPDLSPGELQEIASIVVHVDDFTGESITSASEPHMEDEHVFSR